MKLTPKELRASEDSIFHALEHAPDDRTFLDRLYRDGVPTPEAYLAQKVRVLFVFREPNMRGKAYAHDMRDEVSDVRFQPRARSGGARQERSAKSWWNWKAGMFAHAVDAALVAETWTDAFARFSNGGWNHEVVNRFAYIQVKKVGGGGTSNSDEICRFAEKYATTLRQQIALYQPHLVLGCGVGQDAPARLLATHVLAGGRKLHTGGTGATWWKFAPTDRPCAMLQLWHPARRGLKAELYEDVWRSVREVAQNTGLVT